MTSTIHRLAVRILLATLTLTLLGTALIAAASYTHFASFLLGLLCGVLLVAAMIAHDRRRAALVSVDLPVAVLTKRRRNEWMKQRNTEMN